MAQLPAPEKAEYESRWENLWSQGGSEGQTLKPHDKWDAATSPPSLPALLKTLDDVKGKRVFIPGCGRGYDVVTFAKAGAKEVIGLELSPTAVSS